MKSNRSYDEHIHILKNFMYVNTIVEKIINLKKQHSII